MVKYNKPEIMNFARRRIRRQAEGMAHGNFLGPEAAVHCQEVSAI